MKKILLMPDKPDWAFDFIADAIIKYNPFPDRIEYTKHFTFDYHMKPDLWHKFDYSAWDLVYIFFEGESILPHDKNKLVKGCYSANWIEQKPQITEKAFGEYVSGCRAVVFANERFKNEISPYLRDSQFKIIYDSADENLFYHLPSFRSGKFKVLFVGNTDRPIKRFDSVERICKRADVELLVCKDVPHDKLVYEYAKANIVINCSLEEGGPQVFPEAALCGVPMLISSNNDLSHKIPCFSADSEDLKVAILKFLKTNPFECIIKGQQAREAVLKSFTARQAAGSFAEFFINLLY